jgi:preprotein translocase subunit SecA
MDIPQEDNAMTMKNLKQRYSRICGSTLEYDLTPYYERLTEIKNFQAQLKKKTDQQLKAISEKIIAQAREGRTLDSLSGEAYALISEAIDRVLKLRTFDTQFIGAIVMHQGKIAEMPTGEGKTLTAVFPAYLNALTGNGVHILTFNDYLARRDAEWMGPVYEFLGLKADYVQEGMGVPERKRAYSADVTYLKANEAGFDFLRDSLSYNGNECVHRGLNFVLIDEADSILIDGARIPLVIAAASHDHMRDTFRYANAARKLVKDTDFEFDEYSRNICLTETGTRRVEILLNCGNLYDSENFNLLTQLNCAIHAEFLFHQDIDYIVRDNKIELVDEFTGRVADKRRWPDGLQAALEAKENISIQAKGSILNSITLQHFIGKYSKISGMTATAQTSEEEFKQFYDLDIVVIPPNKPCVREDHPDKLFKDKNAKRQAVLVEIIKANKTMRPILAGTASIQESEMLSEDLRKNGINCVVLNAKNDEYEAGIIAGAGRLNAITISTNMAGRGTDIRLGGDNENEKKQVAALGGLYVIGTNRHESKRIDNQLRGRAGRQNDPGSSRFFISMEDDLFMKYRLSDLLPTKLLQDNQHCEIENRVVNREIERIQRIIEGQNLEIKKTLYKYNLLLEQQREIISEDRNDVMRGDSFIEFYQSNCPVQYNKLSANMGRDKLMEISRFISLYFIDETWSQYLDEITDIREGIHLTRLGHLNPLLEFHKLVIEIFDNLQADRSSGMIQKFNGIDVNNKDIDMESIGLKAPSSTWTYLINDDPFENMSAINFAGQIGLSAGVLLAWPLMLIFPLLKRLRKKKR